MIRASMKLWRDSIDMKIPVADEFKIHFMQNRQPILEGFVKPGTAWMTMLRDMTSTGDAEALLEFWSEVEEFVTWAEGELKAIDQLRSDCPGN